MNGRHRPVEACFASHRQTVWPLVMLFSTVWVSSLVVAEDQYPYFDSPIPLSRSAQAYVITRRFSPPATGSLRNAIELDGDAAAVDRQLSDLLGDDATEFISPIYEDAAGRTIVMTPALMLLATASADFDAVRDALQSAVGPGALSRPYVNLPRLWRYRSTIRDGRRLLDLCASLAASPDIEFVEPDALLEMDLALIPDDPLFGDLWSFDQASDIDMNVVEAWDMTTGSASIVVAVLDVGVEQDHPDLHLVPGLNFMPVTEPDGGPVTDCDDHGTSMSGFVSGHIDNGLGAVGVAPGCPTFSARIATSDPVGGDCVGSIVTMPSGFAAAIDHIIASGIRITSSSFVLAGSPTITTAYDTAAAAGVVCFAATGNDGSATLGYPASLPSVVALGAIQSDGTRASFSQFGSGLDAVAPGVGLPTTDRTGSDGYSSGDYISWTQGTSIAAPYAAGVAALMLSVRPGLEREQVIDILHSSATDLGPPGYDSEYGWGLLDAEAALTAALATPTSSPFVRGDANDDGELNIADAVAVLLTVFASRMVFCDAALDANDDDTIDIADTIHLLDAIFAGSVMLAPPFPACGDDATPGTLECGYFTGCP